MDWSRFFEWAYTKGLPPLREDMTKEEWRHKMEMQAKLFLEWVALKKEAQ